MITKIIFTMVIALSSILVFSPSASAVDLDLKFKQYNGSGTYANQYYRIRNGDRVGSSIVIQAGGGPKTAEFRADPKDDAPLGIKVWQPTGLCTKTYERIAGIWFRTHKYSKQSKGRYVWVTEGIGNSGGADKTKHYRC